MAISRTFNKSIFASLTLAGLTVGGVFFSACSSDDPKVTPATDGGASAQKADAFDPPPSTDPGVSVIGRADTSLVTDPNTGAGISMSWPGVQIRVKFKGAEARASFNESVSPGLANLNLDTVSEYVIVVDNEVTKTIKLKEGTNPDLELWKGVDGEHTLIVYRKTESRFGTTRFNGFTFPGGSVLPIERPGRKLLFLGDSITAAYGSDKAGPYAPECPPDRFTGDAAAPTQADLKSDTQGFLGAENAYNSFAAHAGRLLKADTQLVALSGTGISRSRTVDVPKLSEIYDRVNSENSTPKFDPKSWQADGIVLNIGTNDFVDNFAPADPGAVFQVKLEEFTKVLRAEYPAAQIVLMVGPMVPFDLAIKLKEYADTTQTNLADPKVKVVKVTQNATKVGCEFHPTKDTHIALGDTIAAELKVSLGWK
jgi:lysophospholipase L1-like esterase